MFTPSKPLRTLGALALLLTLTLTATSATAQQPAKADDPKPAADAQLSAAQITEKMQAFYNSTADFQATFKQTFTEVAAGDTKVSIGRVYFKKPGKMRWDYYDAKDPKTRTRIMVSDGEAFWIYEPKFKQVFKQCLAGSKLPTSIRFLMGQGDLNKEFTITLTDKSTPKLPELRLVPKTPTSKYKELRFVVDPGTFQVLKTTVFDPYGNTNEIVFKNPLLNKNLPNTGFVFTQPKDARLLTPKEDCKAAK